jgi:hypothetical protein
MDMKTERQRGVALILVIMIGIGLLVMAVVSLQVTLVHSVTRTVEQQSFSAREIADSGAAHALARIKEGGLVAPVSGPAAAASWVSFSNGAYYYYTSYDLTNNVSTIRAWGRVAADTNPSTSAVAPDAVTWDGTGWMVQGIEITVKSVRYVPETAVYFGNGGIEQPLGGFAWTTTSDPTDPTTWTPITSSPASYQSSSVPFTVSALDYPVDYLANGGTPTPASSNPHPYKVWASQNLVGQFNTEAWFANSAGTGKDPTVNVTPPPTSSFYDTSSKASADYPYAIDPSTELWNKYNNDASVTKMGEGSHSGTYGTAASPGVTFVTGKLTVDSGTTFKGTGILVIRDDYDPNTQTNNTPSTKASLDISGRFEWTGLVIVAGWAPDISVEDNASASATIVGALFGEDSVQSGGETSLDSATITMKVKKPFRVYYSNGLFRSGGLLNQYLPLVGKEVVGIRDI